MRMQGLKRNYLPDITQCGVTFDPNHIGQSILIKPGLEPF